MTIPSGHPHWRDMRLPGWDYRNPGPYSITLCTELAGICLGR
jgi:hypothetical protein